jgi:hypothetical protein
MEMMEKLLLFLRKLQNIPMPLIIPTAKPGVEQENFSGVNRFSDFIQALNTGYTVSRWSF